MPTPTPTPTPLNEPNRVADPSFPCPRGASPCPRRATTTRVRAVLSGGGYRAMLFHVGVLWRLNEAGYLAKLDRVSSVSGGSITAACSACTGTTSTSTPRCRPSRFQELVVAPLRRTSRARRSTPAPSSAGCFCRGTSRTSRAAYRKHCSGDAPCRTCPTSRASSSTPRTSSRVRSAGSPSPTSATTGSGGSTNPTLQLAAAVAASSAFPPVLSPARARVRAKAVSSAAQEDLHRQPFTTRRRAHRRRRLRQHGARDGVEALPTRSWSATAAARCSRRRTRSATGPGTRSACYDLIDNQVRSLRKRQVVDAFDAGERKGAYWGIRTNIADYQLAERAAVPVRADDRAGANADAARSG